MATVAKAPTTEDVVELLQNPASYASKPSCIETIETHISWVFLADRYVYKLKKPVRFEFLDFSTPEARGQACDEEIRLNRRLSRDVYLARLPITLDPHRGLELDGPGREVDYVVKMRRLPQQRALDELIKRRARRGACSMSGNQWDHRFFEVMREEHQQLTDLVSMLRDALSLDTRDRSRVEQLTSRLREVVETHFHHEERSGYLKEVFNRAPGFAGQAEMLLDQHEALLEEVEKLRLLVFSGVESAAWWARIESDFHKLASHLLSHEQAEDKVVQNAFAYDGETGG